MRAFSKEGGGSGRLTGEVLQGRGQGGLVFIGDWAGLGRDIWVIGSSHNIIINNSHKFLPPSNPTPIYPK